MKVLHIINNLGQGGAQKLVSDIVPIMSKYHNIEVEVLLLTEKYNLFGKKLNSNSIKVSTISKRKLRDPLNILYIRDFIVNNNFDIIHVHLFPALYWTSLASKLIIKNKPKFLLTEHSTFNKRRVNKYLRPLEKVIYSNFDKIVSISPETQEELINWLSPKTTEKFITIENGIDIDRYKNAKPYNKSKLIRARSNNVKIVCMVGRFSQQKDQSTIIRALQYLPKNVHLILVGDGELKEKNQLLCKSLGLEDRVHFLGIRDDVERILKTSDIIVLSSNWEGFGLAAVEGMAAGKPVIASNVPGLANVVSDAGLLFTKGKDSDLANKINILIENNDLYHKLSLAAEKRAELFSLDKMVDKYIELYNKIL